MWPDHAKPANILSFPSGRAQATILGPEPLDERRAEAPEPYLEGQLYPPIRRWRKGPVGAQPRPGR
jgi:hypothetical protein